MVTSRIFLQKKLAEQKNDLERLDRLYEEEEKFVKVMEKMVESQTEDHTILEKYTHQDDMTIKVRIICRLIHFVLS